MADVDQVKEEDTVATNGDAEVKKEEKMEEEGGESGSGGEEGEEKEEGGQGEEKLSKREMKRRAKMPLWLEYRKKKRAEERQRKKDRKAALKASGQGEQLRRPKPKKMAESECKMRLVVDMSFDDLMVDKDRRRCISQLGYCYSANKKAAQPTQFHIVGFGGPSRTIYDTNGTYLNWDVGLHRERLEEVVPAADIVYLTAESDNVLTELDDSKAYVIGGLVDHNAHKGLCFKRAQEAGWAHARLPIDEFVKMQSRRVLTVNHVFEIMVLYWATRDWEKAFFTVIPQRKGAEKKEPIEGAVKAEEDGEAEEVKEEEEEGNEADEKDASPSVKEEETSGETEVKEEELS